ARVPFAVTVDHAQLLQASQYLRKHLEHALTCVTLSDAGIFIEGYEGAQIYPTVAHEVVDVCGAGDGVISVLTTGYIAGLKPARMAQLANLAGGLICEEVGVSPVPGDRLIAALSQESFS
ncbi:MAG: PfkB family carbohydrate kinase, partial [Saprospiraceae bacterium]|nr:PfkB family carbohydrate kinase [Saprospiraceae bacterium]